MPRQGISLDIGQLGNDAFQPDPRQEIARILRDLAKQIENGCEEGTRRLHDSNGNTVGHAHINFEED